MVGVRLFAVLGVGVGACRCCRWCERHGVVGRLWRQSWAWMPRGWLTGGHCALGSLCVCRPSGIWWLLVFGALVMAALAVRGRRQWRCGGCVGGRGSRVAPGWRGWTRACMWLCSWCGLFGAGRLVLACVVVHRVDGGAGLAGVLGMGFGVWYVCAEGAVDWAAALWVMQRAVKKLAMPMGRVL